MKTDSPEEGARRWTHPGSDTPVVQARRDLADALRLLMEGLSATGASAEELQQGAAQIRQCTDLVCGQKRKRAEEEGVVSGMGDFMERGPITGHSNPIAPPFRMWPDWEARVARAEGRFGSAYEGGPGIAHGGFVAAMLDELLGMATIFSGGPGMTGELTVRYLRPTPLHRDLVAVARLDGQSGRRLDLSAELMAGDDRIVEAKGLFVKVDPEKFAELHRTREDVD